MSLFFVLVDSFSTGLKYKITAFSGFRFIFHQFLSAFLTPLKIKGNRRSMLPCLALCCSFELWVFLSRPLPTLPPSVPHHHPSMTGWKACPISLGHNHPGAPWKMDCGFIDGGVCVGMVEVDVCVCESGMSTTACRVCFPGQQQSIKH